MIRWFSPWLALCLAAFALLGSCNSVTQPETPSVPKYTVSFQSNGGTLVASMSGLVSGSKIGTPTAPTKQGTVFGGWFKDAGCTQAWNFSTDTITADTTLYAVWTEVGSVGITITNPSNGSITFSGQTSKLSLGDSLTVTASVSGTVQSYAWYLDGGIDATQATATWTGGTNLTPGPHSLMVVAKVQGILYSQSLDFTAE